MHRTLLLVAFGAVLPGCVRLETWPLRSSLATSPSASSLVSPSTLVLAQEDEAPVTSPDETPAAEPTASQAADSDLAKKTQNPVSDLISLPFQNNTSFPVGPDDDAQNVLNIQPVIPMRVGSFNLIHRLIAPIVYQPSLAPGLDDEFGLGDLNYTAFLSPADSTSLIWGVGPVLSLPTATNEVLGSEKWSAGPSVVALSQPGPWVLGALVNNVWSFAGDSNRSSINQMLLQPFVNYNLPDGWYLASAPILTANWRNPGNDRWLVPLGGGAGKIFRIGNQPMNAQVQAFYNVERPTGVGEWTVRFQVQFLFPK